MCIQTYIIYTCTRIVIRASVEMYIIDTHDYVFVRTFLLESVNDTYICIFLCTFVRVSVIYNLNIDFVWQHFQYFYSKFTSWSYNLIQHNIFLGYFLLSFFQHNIILGSFSGSYFNTASSVAPFQF